MNYELLPPSNHLVTLSPCHLVTLSPCHLVTLSPCHLVTLSPCHLVTLSPCHLVTLSPCHLVTASGLDRAAPLPSNGRGILVMAPRQEDRPMARSHLTAITILALSLAAAQQPARSPNPAPAKDATCVVYPLAGIGHDPHLAQWLAEAIPSVVEPESWRADGVTITYHA